MGAGAYAYIVSPVAGLGEAYRSGRTPTACYTDRGSHVLRAFIDFSTAFDMVNQLQPV